MELFQDAHFWVAIGLAIFFGILAYVKVPALAAKALDGKAEKIQAELDQAKTLREEAEALLASIKTQAVAAEKMAAEMIANAKDDAKRFEVDAAAKLAEQIQRRAELADRKIASAEASAMAQVKATAADVAALLAEGVLTARLAKAKSDPLVDSAVAQLASKLQ